MASAPEFASHPNPPSDNEQEFQLYNSFDESCPPGWGEEAVKRIYTGWAEEDKEGELPSTPDS